MKKFYLILSTIIVSAVCFQLSAKTFTVKVSDTAAGYVIDPATSAPVTFDADNSKVFDLDDEVYLNVGAWTGYEIVSILDESGSQLSTSTFPTSSTSIKVADVADNGTVTITYREKEKVYVTFIGDPDQMYVQFNYANVEPHDGKWQVELSYSTSVSVYAKDGYTITSITDENGTPQYHNGSYASVYCEAGVAKTFTVVTADANAARTAAFTVNIDGNQSDVRLQRQSDYSIISLTDASNEVKFNPSSETRYSLSHADYSKSLYKVEKNGIQLSCASSYSNNYEFSVEDGDVISVYTDYPDKDSEVKFNFVNEGTEGVVSGVYLDNVAVSDWAAGFVAKYGQKIRVSFNSSDYNIASVKVNGTELTSYYSYETTITDDSFIFDIEATVKPPKSVTIITDMPEVLSIYTGYNMAGDCYTFTEEETVIMISNSVYSIYPSVPENYMIAAVEINGNNQSYFSSISVNDGDVIVIVIEPVVRDSKFVFYFHESDLWSSATLALANENSAMRREYSFYTSNASSTSLPFGYSHYNFGDVDIPSAFRAYRTDYQYDVVLYRNGEAITGSYGGFNLDVIEDGDVIKAFPAEPATCTVTYDIAENADVEIRHDVITAITNPSVHNVFEGTLIHILPAAAVVDSYASAPTIKVTVNGVSLTADENGMFAANIFEDSNVEITKTSSGIDSIGADDTTVTRVYNLQGIYVGDTTDRLPAGIYIVNGAKVRL